MEAYIVLYVEDDPMSREVMELLLTSVMGIQDLTIFNDSHNFMERVLNLPKKPTVILLDIHVDPHTGFEMLEMLRNHDDFAETTIIALTASVMNEEVQRLISAGFDGIVAKPIDMDSFPEILKRIVNGEEVWFGIE